MAQAITLVGKPFDKGSLSHLETYQDLENIIQTVPLQNICFIDEQLKADPVEFYNLPCEYVGAAFIHEWVDGRVNKLQRYDYPFGTVLTFSQPSASDPLCIQICIDWVSGVKKQEEEEPDYCGYVNEHPCERYARLQFALDDIMLGGQLSSASEGDRSKTFNVNLKVQHDYLQDQVAKAKKLCDGLCPGFSPYSKTSGNVFAAIGRTNKRRC